MKLVSTKQFHDGVTHMLRSKEPLVVTKRGEVAGYYIPHRTPGLPPDIRWKIIDEVAERVRKQLKHQGLTEEEILKDFENWRKFYRTSRRRR